MTLRGAGPLLCYASHSPCSVVLGGAEVRQSTQAAWVSVAGW